MFLSQYTILLTTHGRWNGCSCPNTRLCIVSSRHATPMVADTHAYGLPVPESQAARAHACLSERERAPACVRESEREGERARKTHMHACIHAYRRTYVKRPVRKCAHGCMCV